MSQRKKGAPARKPATKQPDVDIKAAAAQLAEERRSPLSSYLRPFILFMLAAIAVLFLISRLGGDNNSPADTSAEAGFARDMITHHAQAVQTAMIIRDRLPDDAPIELDQFLWDIISTQQNQIGQMEAWLNVWGLPQGTSQSPMAWMGHNVTGLMPGMMTVEQVEELRTLPIDQAVDRFMELMIIHHVSAVDMAEAVIERSDNEVVERLATAMIRTQQAEIDLMNSWIGHFSGDLVTPGDATPVASPVASPEHSH